VNLDDLRRREAASGHNLLHSAAAGSSAQRKPQIEAIPTITVSFRGLEYGHVEH